MAAPDAFDSARLVWDASLTTAARAQACRDPDSARKFRRMATAQLLIAQRLLGSGLHAARDASRDDGAEPYLRGLCDPRRATPPVPGRGRE